MPVNDRKNKEALTAQHAVTKSYKKLIEQIEYIRNDTARGNLKEADNRLRGALEDLRDYWRYSYEKEAKLAAKQPRYDPDAD